MRSINNCFYDKQLTPISKLVYLFLRHKSEDGLISDSYLEIGKALALSKDAIYRAVKLLRGYQFISTQQSGGTPTTYRIC